jgi:hypothetical protein
MTKFQQVFQELRDNADVVTLGWARDTPFRPITTSHSVSLFLSSHCSFFRFYSFSLYPSFRHFSFFPRITVSVHFEILLHYHHCFSFCFSFDFLILFQCFFAWFFFWLDDGVLLQRGRCHFGVRVWGHLLSGPVALSFLQSVSFHCLRLVFFLLSVYHSF